MGLVTNATVLATTVPPDSNTNIWCAVYLIILSLTECRPTYSGDFLLVGAHGRAVDTVDPVVESTGIAQMMSCAIPAPQRGGVGGTVDTLLDVGPVQHQVCVDKTCEISDTAGLSASQGREVIRLLEYVISRAGPNVWSCHVHDHTEFQELMIPNYFFLRYTT